MKIRFHIPKPNHQLKYAQLLKKGMERHGEKDVQIITNVNQYEKIDLLIQWAFRRTQNVEKQKREGGQMLIMERAYLEDRYNWVSLGYGGLNGRADFCNKNVPDDRWNLHFKHLLKPWDMSAQEREYAVLIGQVSNDMSVRHININKWYETQILTLNKLGIPVVFREHPLNKNRFRSTNPNLKFAIDKNESLEETLRKAKFVVTFSSNAGVLSFLNGTPTVTCDEGSMVYDYTSHDIKNPYHFIDRQECCNKLAYCQWLPSELEDGTAWEHIKKKFDK